MSINTAGARYLCLCALRLNRWRGGPNNYRRTVAHARRCHRILRLVIKKLRRFSDAQSMPSLTVVLVLSHLEVHGVACINIQSGPP